MTCQAGTICKAWGIDKVWYLLISVGPTILHCLKHLKPQTPHHNHITQQLPTAEGEGVCLLRHVNLAIGQVLSALFYIHELTDTNDWLVLL